MYQKQTLKNKLRLITVPLRDTKTVTVLIMVGTGSKYEQEKINGISHFTEHLFFKGTKKRPTTKDIAETLDGIGGEYNAFTWKEYTGYYAKVNREHLDIALDVISDMLINSKFDEQEIEKEKGVIVEEINMYLDAPMKYVGELFEELLYGEQPAGRSVLGSKNVIQSLKRSDFLNYIKEHYSPSNMVICVAGNFNEKDIKTKVTNYFSDMKERTSPDKPKVGENQKIPQTLIHYKKTDQTHFCLGVRGYDLFHPLKYAQSILAIVLGGNMSSRLFIKVRENQGLAYYVNTGSAVYTDTGYLVTSAGVNNEKTEDAIKIIINEYKDMAENGITEKELKKAKDFIKGKMTLNLESSDEIAEFFTEQELLKKDIKTPDELMAKINKVTADDVKKAAREIFRPENLNLALIGPFKDEKKFQKLLVL